jgi:OmpA-OmpF porin, OOP family
MKAKGLLLGAMVIAALASPVQAGPVHDESSGLELDANGIAFMNGLYAGYVDLSKARTAAYDAYDGELFNHKARRAARHSPVNPDWVVDRNLSAADATELSAAMVRLRTAFDRGGRSLAPADSATAQVSYDCWIEAAERMNNGVISEGSSDVTVCKSAFADAIAKVEAVANLSLTEMARSAAPAPAPAAAPQVAVAAPRPFTVFFAFDSDNLTAAALEIIDDAVAMADKLGIVDFSVTGHADRAGPEAYNLDLSLRRANSVRDALIQRGVKASGISVGGRGEAELAVPTADGVREPANRRVEIILL